VTYEELAHARGIVRRRLDARKPVRDDRMALEVLDLLDLEAGFREHLLPLLLGVTTHVGLVPEPLRLLDTLVDEDVVLDHDEMLRDAGHFGDGLTDIGEVVGSDAAGDDVEAPIFERQVLRL
jgi:hypothetical protein